MPTFLRPVPGINFEMSIKYVDKSLNIVDKSLTFLSLNICYVLYVLNIGSRNFESLLVFILFKKNTPTFL